MKQYTIESPFGVLADSVRVADSFWTRFRGLMLQKELPAGEGLLLTDCPAIHCCFMRFPIDAVYLDKNMTVLAKETVNPWHLGRRVPGTVHVLELDKGKAEGLGPGMNLERKENRR